ncbi:hypothetical protein ABT369_29960 [Dactylosporangium sp. NPDC000244]|uniref:hypothetical protein n=1 Tax=Dactylosporangium sp. NPDC000244 TaxID=3154365 RepID=UPI00332BA96C
MTVTAATVRSIRAVPDAIGPYACDPPQPPQRPEVFVELDAGSYRLADLAVTLQYDGGEHYSGTAQMRYDAASRAFRYQLPPAGRDNLSPSQKSVSLSATVVPGAPPGTVAPPAPPPGYISISQCIALPHGSTSRLAAGAPWSISGTSSPVLST